MRRPGRCQVAVVTFILLVVIVKKSGCERDTSKKINAEAYLYPEILWQLDYSTYLEDVLENKSPRVHGDERLKIRGDGRGYLKYKASVSSATLSTFTSPCFVDGSKCRTGLTYAFWARIGGVVTSYNNGMYQLLSLKAKGYGDQDTRMQVSYNINGGRLSLRVVVNLSDSQSAEKRIEAGRWYHVIIEYKATSKGTKLQVYVNMESLAVTAVVAGDTKQRRSSEVDLFLGKSVDDKIDDAFSISEVSIDNLAIWKKVLNYTEKTQIYLAEFGKFQALQLTGGTTGPFEMKWKAPYDYYSQIVSYTITWRTGNQTVGTLVYPMTSPNDGRELAAFLEIYERGREYTVNIQANVFGSQVNDLFAARKFQIASEATVGSQVKAYSDTPTSIKLSWIVGTKLPNTSLYTISCNTSKQTAAEEQSVTSQSLDEEFVNLTPNTAYVIKMTREVDDGERRYKVIYENNVKTKSIDFYEPPSKLELLKATNSSLTIAITLPSSVVTNSRIITHVNVHVNDRHTRNDVIELSSKEREVEIEGLDQYTEYDIYAATGDGKTFGKISDIYKYRTKDTDECLDANACGEDSGLKTCVNSNGSFSCYCKEGYRAQGNRCQDFDECLQDPCDDKATCTNTIGTYTCKCDQGYTGNGFNCTDVNECLKEGICGKDEELKYCVNTIGSFNCYCKDGYVAQGLGCTDVDECTNMTACGEGWEVKKCVNTAGSFKCHCNDGYVEEGDSCTDFDECPHDPCDDKATCTNTIGTFSCKCDHGYTGDGFNCTDFDECLQDPDDFPCDEKATCTNNIGAFTCKCDHGYTGDGFNCTDIDECSDKKACGQDSELKKCVNTPGSFYCFCTEGYTKEGERCRDVDECTNTSVCGKDMKLKVCVNEVGSYRCPCKDGYKASNGGCEDVNECEDNEEVCGEDGKRKKCVNTEGSFSCHCKEGYNMEGDRCTVVEGLRQCPGEVSRGINWPAIFTGDTIIVRCPTGTTGNASRACVKGRGAEISVWGKADLSGCVSQELEQIIDLKMDSKKSGLIVANKLNTFVVQETLFGGDVTTVVDMMESIVEESESAKTIFTETVIGLTNNLLSKNTQNAWNDLPQEKRSEDAGLLLETMDTLIEGDAKKSKKQTKKLVTQNVEMNLQPVSMEEKVITVAGNTIRLPEDVVGTEKDLVLAGIAQYRGLSSLIGVPSNTQLKGKMNSSKYLMNSEVTSIFLYPQLKKTFTTPVVIVQQLSRRLENMEPHCVFWDTDEDGWSDKGCKVFSSNATHVTCHCYHLTSFVILMTVSDAHANMTEGHRLALGLITTIGIGISSVALIASLLTFIFVRTLRSIRNTIHQHLVIALFIAQLIFLFGLEMTSFRVGCQIIAAVIHYFFLVAFFVMGLEGVVLYCMLVRVYRSLGTSGYGSVKYVAWCWVFPLIFILINLIIDDGAYNSNQNYCWLSLRNGYVWSFVGPVLVIILGNFIILCMTLRVMTEKAKQRSMAVDEIWFWMKGSCLLLSILGVTWIVGIFYVDQQTIFFAYLFNIINSLQGSSIFLFHCLCDPRVRKAYREYFCCESKADQLLIRTNTRSTRMFSNASRLSFKSKSLSKNLLDKERANGSTPEAEVSLMSSPCGTSTPNDSFVALVGATKV